MSVSECAGPDFDVPETRPPTQVKQPYAALLALPVFLSNIGVLGEFAGVPVAAPAAAAAALVAPGLATAAALAAVLLCLRYSTRFSCAALRDRPLCHWAWRSLRYVATVIQQLPV